MSAHRQGFNPGADVKDDVMPTDGNGMVWARCHHLRDHHGVGRSTVSFGGAQQRDVIRRIADMKDVGQVLGHAGR